MVDYTANSVDFSVLSLYLEYYDIFCFMASFERSTDFEQNCMYSPNKLLGKLRSGSLCCGNLEYSPTIR